MWGFHLNQHFFPKISKQDPEFYLILFVVWDLKMLITKQTKLF